MESALPNHVRVARFPNLQIENEVSCVRKAQGARRKAGEAGRRALCALRLSALLSALRASSFAIYAWRLALCASHFLDHFRQRFSRFHSKVKAEIGKAES